MPPSPLSGLQDSSPPRFLRTTGDPRGTFVLPVSPIYRQLPLRTPPLHRLRGDDTSSGTATASLTADLGDADNPTQLFSLPPTGRTQTTIGPSAFLDGTATDDLSNRSSPAARHLALRRHRPSLAQCGSPSLLPNVVRHHGLPSSGICFMCLCFSSAKRFCFADRFHRQSTPNGFLVDSQPHSRS